MATDQARIHLQVLGEQHGFLVDVPLGPRTLLDLLPTARALSAQVNGVSVDQVKKQGRTISCRAGCGACCRQLVPISLVEARSLADVVAAMSAERQQEVRQRFAAALHRLEAAGLLRADQSAGDRRLLTRDMGHPEVTRHELAKRYFQQGIPCPFLEDESCSVHADRPLVCREYLVTSPAERCAHLYEEPVDSVDLSVIMGAVLMRTAHRTVGAPMEMIPLVLALEWTEAHGHELDTPRDGIELFQAMVGQIDQDFAKGFDERGKGSA